MKTTREILSDFTDELFDTMLNTDYKHLDTELFIDSLDFPNEVDAKKGLINVNYNGYLFTIKVMFNDEAIKNKLDELKSENIEFLVLDEE